MSIYEIFNSDTSILTVILFFLTTIIQISPIKINPWSFLGKKIGQIINSDVIVGVENITKKVDNLEKNYAEQLAVSSRVRILRFCDEVTLGESHSKEHFSQIFNDIAFYEHYCKENPDFINNITKISVKRIEEVYEKCLIENSFL